MQIDSNYGIDWEFEETINTDEETVPVNNIECPIPESNLVQLEEHFNDEYILSSEHFAVDINFMKNS